MIVTNKIFIQVLAIQYMNHGQCTNVTNNSALHKSSGDLNNENLLSKRNKN